jgi:hypothetical protein
MLTTVPRREHENHRSRPTSFGMSPAEYHRGYATRLCTYAEGVMSHSPGLSPWRLPWVIGPSPILTPQGLRQCSHVMCVHLLPKRQ